MAERVETKPTYDELIILELIRNLQWGEVVVKKENGVIQDYWQTHHFKGQKPEQKLDKRLD